ncbi:M24 family metallopeptidase [Conexibacter woesei]|uniref:Peptidase M24 n=1 Tax=Conexibacter woesei (strain DSM 14684 / CCUG 47730 / CIP 108061 / JCM 11494 / NBRC 100937 / ID131577) TaxID=469383 RepID=D3F890_CONWI|nr:Xaa-Pro peptidase family protein [Conexibacter woesei]ADB48960.1 peptidase M24 [Conexibacter woesei DSM 14684]
MAAPGISRDEFEARQRRVAEAARDRGYSAIVVWSAGLPTAWYGDVFYLANHHAMVCQLPRSGALHSSSFCALIVPADGEPVLLTTTLADTDERIAVADARAATHLPQEVARVLAEKGLASGRIGLVAHETMLASSYHALVANLDRGAVLEPCDEVLETMRAIKSPAELALMRDAAGVGIEWVATTMNAIREGRTEGEIVGEGLRYLSAAGGEPYDVIISSGPNAEQIWGSSGIPHWNSDRALVRGDMVHVDLWGPARDGYYTDFGRSTVVGRKPTGEQLEVLEGSIDLIESIVAEIRPGVTFGDLHERGLRWLVENGFRAADAEGGGGHSDVYPSFGHGLGLGVEYPQLIADDPTVVEPNMVIAVETMLGGAFFEHNVVVTETGHEVLTAASPSRWWD